MDYAVLGAYGIDHRAGLRRCMGDEALYMRMLIAFLQEDAFQRARGALDGGRYDELFECVHELKGACANIDFDEVLSAVTPLVERLRGGKYQSADNAELSTLFERLEAAYIHTKEGVSLALGL